MSLAQITNYSPNYKKGVIAAGYIKRLLDSQPEIDAYSEEGEKLVSLAVCLPVCLSLSVSVYLSVYSQLTIFSNK